MKTKLSKIFYCVAACSVIFSAHSLELLDGIAAVVGDSVILVSEVEAYTLLLMNREGIKSDSVRIKELRRQALDELIDGKVFVVHAEKDTNIVVSEEEVENALDRRIKMILQENNTTLEMLEQELQRTNGMSLREFKSQMRKGIKEQLVKQKVHQMYGASINITRKDVEQFYEQYKDSLPSAGKSVRLSKLAISFSPSDSARQAAYKRITTLKERLDNGENFAELARQFSDGTNAAEGGDLGFIGKGTLSELVFEEKAFSLAPGEISEIFETRLGFHIIKVEGRKDQRVHVRQILAQVAPAESEIKAVTSRLDSIRAACKTEENFKTAVKKFSTHEQTKSRGGDFGWHSAYSLPGKFDLENDDSPVGQICPPVKEDDSYALYRITDFKEERQYTLEDDWDLIAEQAKNIDAQKKLIDLVEKWRKETFIDIRL
ncbi:MAG: hypothetical protein GF401_11080 [Chitinivibrionales bacterium]|nr:hypothetical protein [Chitinivibrionales bacterium]